MNGPYDPGSARPLFEDHPRSFAENRYVYPVLSRRSGGVSVGVNLSGDKACNFRCVYCQVDRSQPGQFQTVDLQRLDAELQQTLDLVVSGRLFQQARFTDTPAALRRLNDIALSGDGEPTLHPDFDRVLDTCIEVRRRLRLEGVQLILITNASALHLPRVGRALEGFDAAGGRIWAKLDAGTEAYYRRIARSAVPFARILDNLSEAARARPILIQSLWMRLDGQPPAATELQGYCQRLRDILERWRPDRDGPDPHDRPTADRELGNAPLECRDRGHRGVGPAAKRACRCRPFRSRGSDRPGNSDWW